MQTYHALPLQCQPTHCKAEIASYHALPLPPTTDGCESQGLPRPRQMAANRKVYLALTTPLTEHGACRQDLRDMVRRRHATQVGTELLHHREQWHAPLVPDEEGLRGPTQVEAPVQPLHPVVDELVVHEGHGVKDPAQRGREGPVGSLPVDLPSLMKTGSGPGMGWVWPRNGVGLAHRKNGVGLAKERRPQEHNKPNLH